MNKIENAEQTNFHVFKFLLSDKGLIYGGCKIALICSPLYYILWTYIFPQPYDSLLLRSCSCGLALLVISDEYWPIQSKIIFPYIWLLTLLFIVPFTHIFLALKNQLSPVWIICVTFTPFMLAYFVKSPAITLLLLALSCAASLLLYLLVDGVPFFLLDLIQLSPLMFFVVGGALLLSSSNNKAIEKDAKLQATEALAASIAHEMRNPLAQIHGNLYLIEELQKEIPYMYGAKPVVARHIENAKRVIKSGLQVIDITMDAIRDKPVNHEEFKLLSARAVVDQAVADYAYEELAHAKLVSVEGEDFQLTADPIMVKYVLYNLMQNALWYVKTLPDLEINISLIPSDGEKFHRIEVRDDGPGIAPDDIPNLFDSFYTSGKHGGTGLGLYYCKRTMNALGGDIKCHSELNQYTVFTLSFPIVYGGESKQRELIQDQQQREDIPVSLAGKSVLIVEDNDFSRKLLESILQKLDVSFISAKNGQQAIEMLRQHHFDLVLADMQITVMDGTALTQQIRSCDRGVMMNPAIPIIALTSESENAIETAIQAGINDHLRKPIKADRVEAKLQQWLR